ncbi:GGDEF domain-containing protein [Chelatococcus reniformis]|uniref:GGDEF domain-containing protein n=1 Tax=Chelatococcus reniformis TaxID=1494448 RepID=A0A916UTL2_9HYPH|nr:GGDEF domain-containing protein [Chelatococcus reniformis]GGC86226.1 hypothetical protein GCM10010994_50160 [Chelatococcus reniformis]
MDIASLMAFLSATCALQGGLLLSLRIVEPGLRWFGLAYLACAAAMVLSLARASGAPPILTIVASNALLIWSFACVWQALRYFDEGRAPLWPTLVGSAVWLAACTNDMFLASLQARVALSAWLCAAYAILTARQAWIGRHEPLPSRRVALAVAIAFAAASLTRAAFSRYFTFPADIAAQSTAHPLWYLLVLSLVLLTGASLLAVALAYERDAARRLRSALAASIGALTSVHDFEMWADRLLSSAAGDRHPMGMLVMRLDRRTTLSNWRDSQSDYRLVRRLGGWLAERVERDGVVGLFGDTAIVWLLPRTDQAELRRLADDMRTACLFMKGGAATASSGIVMRVGLACSTQTGPSLGALLARANAALLQGTHDAFKC